MDKKPRGWYNNVKGTNFQILEVKTMSKVIEGISTSESSAAFQQFVKESQGMRPDEIIDFFEDHFALEYGAPGTFLTDLYKEGK
ncbi:hypothetical protein [Alkalihalobacillus sp. CinArs1]|uniref:hypothetical protein n=1 Tax=Alkalihalobacillus sp. CinArs1 TaxID=2995314 RepID=UPI0022DD34E9|nr:hypothetical protein [Alkalihalobacillus sp. CinArs1]